MGLLLFVNNVHLKIVPAMRECPPQGGHCRPKNRAPAACPSGATPNEARTLGRDGVTPRRPHNCPPRGLAVCVWQATQLSHANGHGTARVPRFEEARRARQDDRDAIFDVEADVLEAVPGSVTNTRGVA